MSQIKKSGLKTLTPQDNLLLRTLFSPSVFELGLNDQKETLNLSIR